jgi:DNA-binding MarR family transcriptional regulator
VCNNESSCVINDLSHNAEAAANVVARSKVHHRMAVTTSTTRPDSRQLDERELRAWRGMLRAHAALTKALDADLDSAHGLPLSSYEVLMYLNDAEGRRMRMRDLAASVILSRSGLTRLADRLEREGLIRRESCPSDARGAFAVLTPAGAEMLAAARATHLAGVRSLFLQHFSDDELDALGEFWERVVPGAASAPGPVCG